jgi:hypothetical protein
MLRQMPQHSPIIKYRSFYTFPSNYSNISLKMVSNELAIKRSKSLITPSRDQSHESRDPMISYM